VIEPADTRAALMERWERGWKYLFDALEPLSENDLTPFQSAASPTPSSRRSTASSPTTPPVGQMVFSPSTSPAPTGKLSVPRGQSVAFNEK
jgi:hypothetical protein